MRQVLPTNLKEARGREAAGGKVRVGAGGGAGPQSKCEESLGMSTLMCTGAAFVQSLRHQPMPLLMNVVEEHETKQVTVSPS